MALVALDGTPLVMIGAANRNLVPSLANLGSTTIDAVNEACIIIGYVFTEDGNSHTVDTTGSSSLQWRSAAVTFSNAGTTVKVGLSTVLTTAGPPFRATHASDVITFDVSKSLTGGGGGITANAWQSHIPDTGTKTIANGDLVAFCIQMTARGGTDSVLVSNTTTVVATLMPGVTEYVGGVYGEVNRLPNCLIQFSDGKYGFFYGGNLSNGNPTLLAWNNASGLKEYGNLIQLPFPCKAYGMIFGANLGGDAQAILYSDPLGTPVAEKTISFDGNAIGQALTSAQAQALFPAPFSLAANTSYATILKPTSASNITMQHKVLNDAAHQKAEFPYTNCYAVNRDTGAFAAQNSSKDRFVIGLLIGAFEAGGPSGRAVQINNDSLVA